MSNGEGVTIATLVKSFDGLAGQPLAQETLDTVLSGTELRRIGAHAATSEVNFDPEGPSVQDLISLRSGVTRGYRQQDFGPANDPNRY